MAKVKRKSLATFLDTTPTSATPTWSLCGEGITEATIAYNPQTESETYIHQDSGVTDVTGYQPTIPVSQKFIDDDPVCEYIDTLRRKRAILGDSRSKIVNVYQYDGTGTTYPAEMQDVSIQVDEFGGEGGGSLNQNFTINYVGDPIQGTFDSTTKDFTAT